MAVPSVGSRPRYRTPKVQVFTPQFPTPQPTPAVKTGNQQVSVERQLAAERSTFDPLVRISETNWAETPRQLNTVQPVLRGHEEEEEEEEEGEESARGQISDEGHDVSGPQVSKGARPGFLAVMMRRSWTDGTMIGWRGG